MTALALACALALQAPTASEKCSIRGRAVNSLTGEPVPRVNLTLGGGAGRASASTDGNGQFAFGSLDAGSYLLLVQAAGYAFRYSSTWLSSGANPIVLDSGQRLEGLILKLTPAATISGRVLDERGEPMPSASVMALRPASQRGLGQWSHAAAVTADDHGRFRLSGLWAGRYLLAANSGTGCSTTYFPGTTNPSAATPIKVGVGEKTEVRDFRLMTGPAVRVSGEVTWEAGKRPSVPHPGPSVWLVPVGSVVPLSSPLHWSASIRHDGSFEIGGVPPGLYDLVALDPFRFAARQTLQVGTQDVEGANLELHPGISLPGRVVTEDGSTLYVKSAVRLHPSLLAEAPGLSPRLDPPTGWAGEGGRFAMRIFQDRYRWEVRDIPSDSYVKSVRLGGLELTGDWLDFRHRVVTPLEIVLGKTGSRVYGAVLGKDGKPSGGATVVLAPRPMSYSLLKAAQTDSTGRFLFTEAAPGDYFILAWEDFEASAHEDLDFLRCYEPWAVSLSLGENEAKSVSLRVIPPQCEPR